MNDQADRLPDGWQIARLGDVAFLRKKPRGLKIEGEVPFVPMALISAEGTPIEDHETRPKPTGTYFENDDLLLARITPCFENGKQGIARGFPNGYGYATTEVLPIVCSEALSAEYLRLFLRQIHVHACLVRNMAGATGRMRLPAGDLLDLRLPVPPLAEQRRIVVALEMAHAAIDAATVEVDKAVGLANYLLPAAMHRLIDLHGATSINLGEIAQIASGLTKGRRLSRSTTDYPFLRAANVRAGSVDLEEVKTIPATPAEAERSALKRGDLLMVEGSGSAHRLGQGWIWEGAIDPCLHQNHVFRARPDQRRVRPGYLAWALQTPATRAYFRSVSKTTSGLATINRKQVSALSFPLPSLDDQEVIVRELEGRRAYFDAVTEETCAIRCKVASLRSSLLHRAFTGQLVPQDPFDEPASQLLARIAREKIELDERRKAEKRTARAKKTTSVPAGA
ncbi:MAG: restriction endonuclease subunit S [Solirubrobacteraceae bacterium]